MENIVNTTETTLALMKASLAGQNELSKSITIATGLTAYDLQGPAKNLYPQITPLRNKLPRVGRVNPGDAAHWRTISSVVGSGYDGMGWVPEGQRSGAMSYSATAQTAPYLTLGEEDWISLEAESAAAGYEDVNATSTLRLLQKTMRKEETGLLGGNASLALGTPATPSLGAAGSGGTLPGSPTTYSVIVVCLTQEGNANSSLSAGVATSKTITGMDGSTYTLYGGSSQQSAAATQAVSLGQKLSATLDTIPPGTAAFAWYVGTAGNETLQTITSINSAVFSVPLTGGRQAATLITADHSKNASLAFDGLLTIGANPASNSYYKALATGTAGVGTVLTASGRGSVTEIDDMLIAMWNNYRLSPTVIYVNAQEQRNITSKCLTAASGPLVRYNIDASGRSDYSGMTASGAVRWYYNPFSVDGGQDIPILVHPDLPPGTIMSFCEQLPVWYQSNQVPNTFEVLTRRDYYRIDWPMRTRRREFGVYMEETLAAYAPFAIGIITNVGNG